MDVKRWEEARLPNQRRYDTLIQDLPFWLVNERHVKGVSRNTFLQAEGIAQRLKDIQRLGTEARGDISHVCDPESSK